MEPLILEEAVKIVESAVHPIREEEDVELNEALERVLSRDICALRDQPPFPRSPLDGYALRSADIASAGEDHPVTLRVIGEVTAGHMIHKKVEPGTAVRIMTGAPIPEGADCVIRQEDTDYGEERVQVRCSVKPWGNYCFAGEDYHRGDLLLKAGTLLGPVEIGILASLGLKKVSVYRKPKVLLMVTGDEVVLPGEDLGEGKIYDSNLFLLSSRLKQLGADFSWKGQICDDALQVAGVIREKIEESDLVVTTGGVSVGKKDIMHDVFWTLDCERLFWRIAIKPGMPTLCGKYQDRLLVCLSGNPYGAFANLELLVRPVLSVLSSRPDLLPSRVQAVMENSYLKRSPARRYLRAYYKDGKATATEGSNDSGILYSMCGCNAMIEIPAGTEQLKKGDPVWVVLM